MKKENSEQTTTTPHIIPAMRDFLHPEMIASIKAKITSEFDMKLTEMSNKGAKEPESQNKPETLKNTSGLMKLLVEGPSQALAKFKKEKKLKPHVSEQDKTKLKIW